MPIIRDTELSGKRVITDDAADVGTVGDIYVDVHDWHITRFDLRVEKRYTERLGAEGRVLRRSVIPIRTHMVRAVGDVVHLKENLDDLKRSTKPVQPPSKKDAKEEPKAEAKAEARAEAKAEPRRSYHQRNDDRDDKPRKL